MIGHGVPWLPGNHDKKEWLTMTNISSYTTAVVQLSQ